MKGNKFSLSPLNLRVSLAVLNLAMRAFRIHEPLARTLSIPRIDINKWIVVVVVVVVVVLIPFRCF